MGILKSNIGNFIDAEVYYSRALDLNIDNLIAIQSLIDLSYKTERFDLAHEYLNRFLEIYPTNLNMLFAMAGIQFKMGRIEDSLQTLDDVLSLNPKHQKALDFKNRVQAVSIE